LVCLGLCVYCFRIEILAKFLLQIFQNWRIAGIIGEIDGFSRIVFKIEKLRKKIGNVRSERA
jgi:hypothetical protein